MSERFPVFGFVLLTASQLVGGAVDQQGHEKSMQLQSKHFNDGATIPAYFTCDGPNVSPTLFWNQIPGNTKSFALILKDKSTSAPKGSPFHWVAWSILEYELDVGHRLQHEGTSDFKHTAGYRGPCPEDREAVHNYTFTLYALDFLDRPSSEIVLDPMTTAPDLIKAIRPHVLGTARLSFQYRRSPPMLNLPPEVTNTGPDTANLNGWHDQAEPGPVLVGNGKLSGKLAPDLVCYACAQLAAHVSSTLPASKFVRSDAAARRDQAALVSDALEAACAPEHFTRGNFPPKQVADTCLFLQGEIEDVDEAFLRFRGDDSKRHLCWTLSSVCEGLTLDQVDFLGVGGDAEHVDAEGRRWRRTPVCAKGYKEEDGACVAVRESDSERIQE